MLRLLDEPTHVLDAAAVIVVALSLLRECPAEPLPQLFAADGSELVSHQAFWFAWSQFHPTTLVWSPLGG